VRPRADIVLSSEDCEAAAAFCRDLAATFATCGLAAVGGVAAGGATGMGGGEGVFGERIEPITLSFD